MRGQCEHIPLLVLCVDFIVGKVCILHCVPYNLLTFSMKQNHHTAEFKKKKKTLNLAA
jgi:hypothetical protein